MKYFDSSCNNNLMVNLNEMIRMRIKKTEIGTFWVRIVEEKPIWTWSRSVLSSSTQCAVIHNNQTCPMPLPSCKLGKLTHWPVVTQTAWHLVTSVSCPKYITCAASRTTHSRRRHHGPPPATCQWQAFPPRSITPLADSLFSLAVQMHQRSRSTWRLLRARDDTKTPKSRGWPHVQGNHSVPPPVVIFKIKGSLEASQVLSLSLK